MKNFAYFKRKRIYNEIYFQYPIVFIYGERYKTLSEGAKIAYMLLKNELNKAIKLQQVDEADNVYFEMTISYLAMLMNCSERKVIRIKKELENENLLLQVKMGFNKKTGKNEPNRLYLAELEVSDRDVYLITKNEQTLDTSGSDIMAPTPNQPGTLDTSGSDIMAPTSNRPETLDTSGSDIMAVNVYKSINKLDTNRHNIDTEKDRIQDQLLLDGFVELMQDPSIGTFIPEIVLNLIRAYSPTFDVARETVKTIHNAKNKAQQNTGITLIYEDLGLLNGKTADAILYTTLLKAYQKQRTEKVENLQNLIFVYVRNFFEEQVTPKFNTQQTT